MKKDIFNRYVNFVCHEMGITREQLFRKNRTAKVSTARFLLYLLCFKRPMKITRIVDLMLENGYKIARTGVEYGITKLKNSNDIDLDAFIKKGVHKCSSEDKLESYKESENKNESYKESENKNESYMNKEKVSGISDYQNSNLKKRTNVYVKLPDARTLQLEILGALKLLRKDYIDGIYDKDEYKEEREKLIKILNTIN